ncbi:MAG: SDR family NAD(P)-dependent oxidoreductase [Tropicimonas sp.]|uniref:SDR family NAD(P)-dependent oxidoreductase n=1 Tax=Tropicimonas sp. TaxID=2067044 RepID=UPI003A88EE78
MADRAMSERPVALITGASYGIGAASALALARAGYDVAVTARALSSVEATAAKAEELGAGALPLALDVTDQSGIEAVTAAVLDRFGHIDVLVNNAGGQLMKPALDVTREDWDRVVAVNLTGAFFMSQAVARHLIETGRPGAIVNVTSTSGLVGRSNSSGYGSTKAGLIQLTRMLAIEWAKNGIRVNGIAPASTLTPTRKNLANPERRDQFLAKIPIGRFGTPEEMGAAVAYLAGPDAGFITGQILVLDGGLTAA